MKIRSATNVTTRSMRRRNIERAIDRIEQTADACWPDIEKQCSDTAPGGGRVAQCLVAKKASLSAECAAAIDKFAVTK